MRSRQDRRARRAIPSHRYHSGAPAAAAGHVADRGESARRHATGGGGVWLMVVLAADAWPSVPRPVPAAGRGDRPLGPVLPGRGTRAGNARTPHRIAGVLIKMVAGPIRARHSRRSHGTPFQQNERRDARGVWTSSPACRGSRSKSQSSRRPNRCKPARSLRGPDAGPITYEARAARRYTRLGCSRLTRSRALLDACRLVTGFISKVWPACSAASPGAPLVPPSRGGLAG